LLISFGPDLKFAVDQINETEEGLQINLISALGSGKDQENRIKKGYRSNLICTPCDLSEPDLCMENDAKFWRFF